MRWRRNCSSAWRSRLASSCALRLRAATSAIATCRAFSCSRVIRAASAWSMSEFSSIGSPSDRRVWRVAPAVVLGSLQPGRSALRHALQLPEALGRDGPPAVRLRAQEVVAFALVAGLGPQGLDVTPLVAGARHLG